MPLDAARYGELAREHVRALEATGKRALVVGGSALYLLSGLSSGVTGEIHYVDSGYNIVSMPTLDELKRIDESYRAEGKGD